MNKRPMTRVNLDKAISRLAKNDPRLTVDIRMSMANAIVGQFIPEGVVKGGTSLKFRYGATRVRYTMDLDTAWRTDLGTFLKELKLAMSSGWEGFTGEVVVLPQASPSGIPFDYVMQPCDVKLSYMGRSWCSVRLEIGHNEVGDADEAEVMPVPHDLEIVFEDLCFPVPKGLPLMRLPYQVAQKLHGATGQNSKRAHDIIDLQLIFNNSPNIDLREVRMACIRLFAYRKGQTWPPIVRKGEDWDVVYANKRQGLEVLSKVDEAIIWANDLIARIDAAK